MSLECVVTGTKEEMQRFSLLTGSTSPARVMTNGLAQWYY